MKLAITYKIIIMVIIALFVNSASAQSITLTGRVQSEWGVMPAATVTVAGQTKITDSKGEFSFTLSPGQYIIVVTHSGYKKKETSITMTGSAGYKVEVNMIPDDLLDEITIMGSGTGTERSNLNTAVPIDVLTADKLSQSGQPGLIQMLFYSLPSLHAERQRLSEPVTYRGLDPHHLLVLLNNTRYHNSAWLNNGVPKSDLGRGSTGNDLGTIPFAAIDKIEVLRDGASAQYGSDAIAGVLNVRLKESTGKTMIHVNTGQYYPGDGFKSWIGFYRGIQLNKKGFLGISGEVRTQGPTTRAGTYSGLVYEVYRNDMTETEKAIVKSKDDSTLSANGIDRSIYSENNGTVKLGSAGFLVNGTYPFSDRLKISWTGTLNYKNSFSWGNYRFPNDSVRVNKMVHPHGFKPVGTNANLDATAIAGIKRITAGGWQWELSSSFGNNTLRMEVDDSNNASQQTTLGASAPTSFYLGTYVYSLFTNNLNISRDFSRKGLKWRSAKLVFGLDWRFENYKLKAGDEAAYTDYDGAGYKQAGAQPSIGSVNSSDALSRNRSASSAYINWEAESNDLLIDLAARYEYYTDFGNNLAGKLAVRYKFSSRFSVRSSISNGYRAPSLQQRYFSGLQSFRGSTLVQRVFNNQSPITRAFHIPSLSAERAMNLSIGFTSRISSSLSLTVDGYFVQIRDRIVLSGVFRRTDPQVAAILVDYPGIDFVQFYVNAINTRTYGVDAVINGNWNINKTKISATLAGNISRHKMYGGVKTTDVVTNISNYSNTLFGVEERTTLLKEQPGEKIIASVYIVRGKWGFTLRNTYFGRTGSATLQGNPVDTIFRSFSPRVLTDGAISYQPKSWITISLGANNIFDVYPDRLFPYVDGVSLFSNSAIPYGTNGGYYYLNMHFKW